MAKKISRNVVASLLKCAHYFDSQQLYTEADTITKVLERLAQSRSWWQNEAGEPMYSPEAIRAEEWSQHEPEYNPDDFLSDRDMGDEEEEHGTPIPPPHGLIEAFASIIGPPCSVPYVPAENPEHPWWVMDDRIQFKNAEDERAVGHVLMSPPFDQWECSFNDCIIWYPTEESDEENYRDTGGREDFGWGGDERMFGE